MAQQLSKEAEEYAFLASPNSLISEKKHSRMFLLEKQITLTTQNIVIPFHISKEGSNRIGGKGRKIICIYLIFK